MSTNIEESYDQTAVSANEIANQTPRLIACIFTAAVKRRFCGPLGKETCVFPAVVQIASFGTRRSRRPCLTRGDSPNEQSGPRFSQPRA